jgi:hypothetical protein
MSPKLKDLIIDSDLFSYYQNAVQYIKGVNAFDLPEMTSQKWGFIKELQVKLSKPNYDIEAIFCEFVGIEKNELPEIDANGFFMQVRWILDELKKLTEQESTHLGGELTREQIMAGFEELEVFGYFATLDGLAGGSVWNYDKVLAQPYARIFAKLLLNKKQMEIQKRHDEIILNKNR